MYEARIVDRNNRVFSNGKFLELSFARDLLVHPIDLMTICSLREVELFRAASVYVMFAHIDNLYKQLM